MKNNAEYFARFDVSPTNPQASVEEFWQEAAACILEGVDAYVALLKTKPLACIYLNGKPHHARPAGTQPPKSNLAVKTEEVDAISAEIKDGEGQTDLGDNQRAVSVPPSQSSKSPAHRSDAGSTSDMGILLDKPMDTLPELQEELRRQDLAIISLQTKAAILEETVETKGVELNGLQTEFDKVKGKLETVEGQLATVQGELTTVQGQLATVEGKLGTIEENFKKLLGSAPVSSLLSSDPRSTRHVQWMVPPRSGGNGPGPHFPSPQPSGLPPSALKPPGPPPLSIKTSGLQSASNGGPSLEQPPAKRQKKKDGNAPSIERPPPDQKTLRYTLEKLEGEGDRDRATIAKLGSQLNKAKKDGKSMEEMKAIQAEIKAVQDTDPKRGHKIRKLQKALGIYESDDPASPTYEAWTW